MVSDQSLPEEFEGGSTTAEQEHRPAVANALATAGFDDVRVLPAETVDAVLTPRRRTILQALEDRAFESQRELAEHLGFDPGNLSHDLNALESAGLVAIEETGRTMSLSLQHGTVIQEPIVASPPDCSATR